MCCLLEYVGEILSSIKKPDERAGVTSPVIEQEVCVTQEVDSDWEEDLSHEEDDTAGEDSVRKPVVDWKQQ